MTQKKSASQKRARPRSMPPDPSRPDPLKSTIRDAIVEFLSDPLNYPDEMNSFFAQYTSLNSIQSVTA